ncbi:MAG TPA: ribosomal protein S18-alanine N-acetyltransferase, partial [Burkholderiaceae bacterium]|nr:ribosomal protein S18-alanine N-acetyltransferase [Burkholderiaceae bacterium]
QPPMLVDRADLAVWLGQWLAAQPAAVQRVWLSGDLTAPGTEVDDLIAVDPERVSIVPMPEHGWTPDACVLAELALQAWHRNETVPPEDAMPLYVRNKVAFTIAEREHGAGGNPRAPGLPDAIHPMLPAHLESVAGIEASVQSFPWTLKNFQDSLQAGYPAWVSMHAGQVTGYAIVMMAPDVAHLLVIGVDPAHQGKGTGRLLLEYCEQQARDKGASVMVLEVRQSNRAAIGFYRHMGYQTFSTRKDYYPAGHGRREHADAMKKTLSLAAATP